MMLSVSYFAPRLDALEEREAEVALDWERNFMVLRVFGEVCEL